MSSSDRGSKATIQADAWQTYRRLIAYVRPHRGMFMLGMLGAILFSLTMVSFTGFAKVFGDGRGNRRQPIHGVGGNAPAGGRGPAAGRRRRRRGGGGA